MGTEWLDNRPTVTVHDAVTGETVMRQATDDDLAILEALGWTPSEETATDEAPASDDAGAPSTDAG